MSDKLEAILVPQPLTMQVSDLALENEPVVENVEPVVESKPRFKIIPLTFPIDISNIKAKEVTIKDSRSCTIQRTYDVSSFSAVKYQVQQLAKQLFKDFPGWQFKIYEYRATWRSKNPTITKLGISFNYDSYRKFIHCNVELLN